MKRTLTEQYGLIKEGKGHKDVFLKEAKRLFPNLIRQGATYNEVSKILKQKNIINENFVGLGPINNPFEVKKKEGYESAFENFLKEAAEVKAEEKKVSKEVEEDQSRGYDNRDEKNPNNMIFGQIQMGYYNELKNPKNADKTEQEIKDIVFKNLAKDPIYYTTHGQFGEEDLGYTDEAPSLGEPKEPKGPYKSSGYGTLKESIESSDENLEIKALGKDLYKHLQSMGLKGKLDFAREGGVIGSGGDFIITYQGGKFPVIRLGLPGKADESQIQSRIIDPMKTKYKDIETEIKSTADRTIIDIEPGKSMSENLNEHSISMAGGIVTGGGFVNMDYRDYFDLREADGDVEDTATMKKDLEDMKKSMDDMSKVELFYEDDLENEAPEHIEKLVSAAGDAYDAGMDIKEIISMIEQHLGLKMGDY